jgi:fatty-acyl-CoA synthase
MFDRHRKVWPSYAPQHLVVPDTNVAYNLDVAVARFGERRACVYYGGELSYRQLHAAVERLAGYLQRRLGVRKGDRVLLYMQNSPQWVISYYAILRADAVVVPVNPMNLSAELEHYCEDTEAAVALVGQELYRHIAPLLRAGGLQHVIVTAYSEYIDPAFDLPIPDVVKEPVAPVSEPGALAWQAVLAAGERPGEMQAGSADWSVFPYSSGTTGAPKGCVHTHRSVMASLVASVVWNPNWADSVHLVTLPLFHVTGMQSSMNGPIFVGGCMVIMTRWDRKLAAELIQRYRVTRWRNISTMVLDLVNDPQIRDYDLSSLEAIGGGGAAMPEAVAARLFELTGLQYVEGYGLSETIAGIIVNPPHRPKRQCLGVPLFDVDARVIDVESGKLLGPGEVGEIVLVGAQVFQGYWKRPEETEAAFMELEGKRFFRTGDLGYYDDEGYFFMVDRVKRMINASGFKVWPSEVESLMHRHPDIAEVCVIGAPDARRGETVKAFVVLRPQAQGQVSEQGIIDWCRENMAAYKVPRLVEFADSLPRSGTGKLQWRVLQEAERGRGPPA